MSGPNDTEPMDIMTPTNSSAPASATKSPDRERERDLNGGSEPMRISSLRQESQGNTMTMPAPAAAAAAVHGPKIVQTAFIHKLYNMLEDTNIQHLIRWSTSEESFVMSPSSEFSKVLAQYFKHTNISSFVRQLNMYGFHKVSDVFHNGSPDAPLWEFKHGNNNFKRGDLVGLREIKRRASRHSLVNPKPPPSQPGTPAEPMQPIQDGGDPRLNNLERSMHDLYARLDRSESNAHYMQVKHQALLDSVSRLLIFNQEMSRILIQMVSPDNPSHRDVLTLRSEIQRQAEIIRGLEDPHEPPYSSSRAYFSNIENAPVSPRQLPQDDARRTSLAVPGQSRAPYDYRPQVPSNLSISTRRPYGSIGGNTVNQVSTPTAQPSPSTLRPQAPPPPPAAHQLAAVEPFPGSLARRHTSADIRAHGWQAQPPPPFSSGPPSGHLPSSPNNVGHPDDRRDSYTGYPFPTSYPHSRPPSPPPTQPNFSNGESFEKLRSWEWGPATQNRRSIFHDGSAPPTRRGSMAHILNNDDTDNSDPRGDDDRKRKRLA
ncbi:Transcription factor SFL1 [Cytospora mali]|uniref:Transcription factor SFL1 n=1 Tax=Cytospora mali TaxID=578113 RepID=A0A194V9I1_CYTMA|nr:Transcription factor SFL1 [Valsa mali var. pyri (nom. inval.)]